MISPATTKRVRSNSNSNFKKLLNKFPHGQSSDSSEAKCPFQHQEVFLDEPTQEQIDLVRTSWERVSEIRHDTDDRNVSSSHAFGLAFYDALFEMNIECKYLFSNVFQQARALSGMISFISRAPKAITETNKSIRDINAKKTPMDEADPEFLALKMQDLGAKHYFYKVQPHHFDLVGPAFVAALKKRLGEEYTDDIGEAWVKANAYAAYNMKIGYTQQAWEVEDDRTSGKKVKAGCLIQ